MNTFLGFIFEIKSGRKQNKIADLPPVSLTEVAAHSSVAKHLNFSEGAKIS